MWRDIFLTGIVKMPREQEAIMSASKEKPAPQNRTYTVDDIAAILGIGRTTAYKLAKSGAFKIIRIGNVIRISRQSFEEWLEMEEPEKEVE